MSPPKSKIHFFGGTILLFLSMADRDFGLFRYGERAEYAFTGYGLKQLMAGGGVALIGITLVPLLSGLFG